MAALAQGVGRQQQVVVLHPDGHVGRDQLDRGVGEGLVDLAVGLPLLVGEGDVHGERVEERPQSAIAEAVVEQAVPAFGVIDPRSRRLQRFVEADVGRVVIVGDGVAAPAQPQPATGAQGRLQRGDHAADVALAIRFDGLGGADGRQAVGDDQQVETLAAVDRSARPGDQPPRQRPVGLFGGRRWFAAANLAEAHGGQPGQKGGRGRRVVEMPAGVAAARRADEHRLIGRADLAEHILVGQVVAQHQQAAAGGQLVAQPGHGQTLADAPRPNFHDFRAVEPLEARHAGQPLINDGVDFHQHGRAGQVGHLTIVDGGRPAFALDQRAVEAGGDALQLLVQRLDVAGRQADGALPGRAAPLPGAMLGHQPQVGHGGQQTLQLLALAAADDDQPQAGQLV